MKTYKDCFSALKKEIEKSKITPESVVGTILHAWCADQYPRLTVSSLPVNKHFLTKTCVKSILEMLVNQPFLESIYYLSSTYALLSTKSYRKSLAMYFTPPSLTVRLLADLKAQGVKFDCGKYFDPACGGAAFLAPVALEMKATMKNKGATPSEILTHIENNLCGMEIDGNLCALSTHFLKMALYEEIGAVGWVPDFNIQIGNSLSELVDFYGTIDVLLCNPPYRKLNVKETKTYKSDYAEISEGQPNMYGLFIFLSIKLLKNNGICSVVTPTSFLSGRYFSKLRSVLLKETQLVNIGIVSGRTGVFIDVLQETSITMFRRNLIKPTHNTTTTISSISRNGESKNVGSCFLPNSGAVWPIPRIEADVLLIEKSSASSFRINDYGYDIRIGCFVWNRDIRPVYMTAAEAKRKKTKTAIPLLWSSDIKHGENLCFTGNKKDNGEPCFVDFGDRLHRSIIRRKSLILQRVTSNDQSRRLVVSIVPESIFNDYGGFVGENHIVILEQVVSKPVLSLKQMAELLGSYEIDRYFRSISSTTNVSAFELSQLPLPDPGILKFYLSKKIPIEEASKNSILDHSSFATKNRIRV